MSQRMGRAAEDAFKLLCSRAEITCNKSNERRLRLGLHRGDAFAAPPGTPLDKWPGAVPVFVQVKSTGDSDRTIPMKVRNA